MRLIYLFAAISFLFPAQSAANEPVFTAQFAVNEAEVESTCQAWYVSWRTDKADLRAMIRESMMDVFDEGDIEAWSLCLLMNVDYYINTVLRSCDVGMPLHIAGPAVLQALGERCAA